MLHWVLPNTTVILPRQSEISYETKKVLNTGDTAGTAGDSDGPTGEDEGEQPSETTTEAAPANVTTKVLESIIRLRGVSLQDSGEYSCMVTLRQACCNQRSTVKLVAYERPSYGADLVIVAAIAFVEIVCILTLKTWQGRQSAPKAEYYPSAKGGKDSQTLEYTPLKVLSYREIEEKPSLEEQPQMEAKDIIVEESAEKEIEEEKPVKG
jgi:hypothetical protein